MQKLHFAVFGLTLGALSGSVAAQSDPVGAAQLQPVPLPQATPVLPQVQAPPITVEWNRAAAGDLLNYIERVDGEGLDPADYEPERLREAIGGRDATKLNTVATELFLRLSSDLALGHVRGDSRVNWHVNDPDLNGNEQYAMMERAVKNGSVRDTLSALLPTHPQYAELKSVLAATPKSEKATLEKIRINMDRWRWLPRDLGQKYVIVNVPAYMVALVEDGRVVARRRAVAGAVKTATPQLNASISGVIFNPWWEVPKSIAPEVRGKKGYVAVKDEQGNVVRYRQPPGPSNALGRMKLVMPNDHAIYLHDTNAKGLFDKQARAYSHGCIRTEDALGFAEVLLQPTGKWDKEAIRKALASGKSVQASLAAPVPVYITYFTAAAIADKREIIAYKDIYSRDTPVVTALNRGGNTAFASN
ncbi:MAG: L,D-transpeptidase family protein [Pseudomonadota bacterium]|nr:L,D-transpeptidase family protein [Pseudomonadota bacterium]